ncbi:MAG: copper transporter, partial [Buchananella hordeovulneris]|nr:copper transporter [Buchananella hordeovulneris]
MTMLNFRYHVVSLVAVFLALAIGVVLGAGPLQRPLSDSLAGQLTEAREARDDYKAQVGNLEGQIAGYGKAAAALKPDLVNSALTGLQVAVVSLPGAAKEDVEAALGVLGEAGAQVVAQVEVTPAFTDPATTTYRTTFAGQLRSYLEPDPGAQATTEEIFALALAQVLTSSSEDAVTVAALLQGTDTPFITASVQPAAAAHSVLVIGPRNQDSLATALGNPDADTLKRHTGNLVALSIGLGQAGSGGAVVADATGEQSLLAKVRASGQAVSTLDGVGTEFTTVFIPRVLAASIAGKHGAYGASPSATEGMPVAVALPPLPDVGTSVLAGAGTAPAAPTPAPSDAPAP